MRYGYSGHRSRHIRHGLALPPAGTTDAKPAPPPIVSRWPVHGAEEIDAVVRILQSGRVNSLHHGEQCAAFEAAFAAFCDMPHAITLANGTLALELALRALGIGPGDEVIVPARSFVASASCVMVCGAIPVFADVDPASQALSAATIERHITDRTRAILVVHLGGHPAAMPPIVALAAAHGLKLIEDCAQAHGATLDGRPVGGFGDAAAFSFCTDKIISTGGEGGMLLLRDEAAWLRAWSFKDHGKDRRMIGRAAGGQGFRWLHQSIGSNYRMTEMQAAIGRIQLARLPETIARRRHNAAILHDALDGAPTLRLVQPPASVGHAYYKYYAFVRPEMLGRGWSRDRIVEAAVNAGIPCMTGSCPEIYRERAFTNAGIGPDVPLKIAHLLGRTSLMLPVDPTLDDAACRRMGETLFDICMEARNYHDS
jgi:dTDP-4-amino-4,6-dideoxygalactose transaminase